MALAIKFGNMIASGEVTDMPELARIGHVTCARMTQIKNLFNLAPEHCCFCSELRVPRSGVRAAVARCGSAGLGEAAGAACLAFRTTLA